MAFIIGGHPRSGTTLLFRLCRDHPQIGITGEFKCFQNLDSPYAEYCRSIETDWRRVSFYWRIGRRAPWYFKLASGISPGDVPLPITPDFVRESNAR